MISTHAMVVWFAAAVTVAVMGAGPASAGTNPATAPADRFARDLSLLGDEDAAVRRGAADRLLGAGAEARPALLGAAAAPEPEVSARAAVILRGVDARLFPETTAAAKELIAR